MVLMVDGCWWLIVVGSRWLIVVGSLMDNQQFAMEHDMSHDSVQVGGFKCWSWLVVNSCVFTMVKLFLCEW